MVFGFLTSAATTLIGTLFPAYRTFRSVEKSNTREMRHWMRYWTVFGISKCVERVATTLFLDYLIPGYDIFVLLYYCWCALPVAGGTDQMFLKYIRPFLRKHESQIDCAIAGASASLLEKFTSTVSSVMKQAAQGVIGAAFSNQLAGTVQSISVTYQGDQNRPMLGHLAPSVHEEEQEDSDVAAVWDNIQVKEEPLFDGYEEPIRPTPRRLYDDQENIIPYLEVVQEAELPVRRRGRSRKTAPQTQTEAKVTRRRASRPRN